jgi:hypothetical protein
MGIPLTENESDNPWLPGDKRYQSRLAMFKGFFGREISSQPAAAGMG